MQFVSRTRKVSVLALIALVLASATAGGQAPSQSVTPANPSVLVGQTQQFTANGMAVPNAVGGGGWHTCMLFADQTVRCAGKNNFGQLGNNSFNDSSTLVQASGLTTATGVGAGIEHSCALLANGTLSCWGTNFVGQLGDGTVGGGSPIPKAVQGVSSAIALASGGYHNCVVLSDRSVRCWGRNQDGQLGNGSTTDAGTPQVVSGLSNVAALAGGGYHSCALMPDATVRCWGRNDRGQLGDGTSTSSSTPVAVSGMTNAAAITGGLYHTCALLRDGTVQCWGQNDSGQIGNTLAFSSVPVTVGGITSAIAVSAGVFHTCALLSDRTARCWGQNQDGQLGNGTTTNSSSPVTVAGLSGAIAVTSAGLHTCALMPNGSATCWGSNSNGQLANGTFNRAATPVPVTGTGLTWTSSNPGVATINASGLATAVAAGTTTISAVDGFGGSASTTLTVTQPVQRATLSVLKQGNGTGNVSSSPSGISCGADCFEDYDVGTTVTLAEVPVSGSVFTGWTGCDSVSGTSCTVTMNAGRTVTATFGVQTFALQVDKTGNGGGTVTSSPAGITCGTDCSESYAGGTAVTLSASANGGSNFSGWTGCDSVSGPTCTVTMNDARSVTAGFNLSTFTLSVSKQGNGSGTVTSNPAGINCGADCSEPFASGTAVTLNAAVTAGSQFAGWTACDSVSGTTCTVSVNAARVVSASFNAQSYLLTVGRTGAGNGTVTSSPAGISCGADCSEAYTSGTTVTLTAAAAAGSLFAGWSNCTSVAGATCTVSMTAAKAVAATFNLQYFTLAVSKSGLGSGTVTSNPAGINCGSTCSASYASNAVVTLTANPALLSGFTGWSGCDTVSGTTCTVAVNRARAVVASFRLLGLL